MHQIFKWKASSLHPSNTIKEGAKHSLNALFAVLWWQNCWPDCSFISSCWTQNEENKIQILNLYVNIQMTHPARKAVLNNKNFCTDSHFIMYKSLLQTLCKRRLNVLSQMYQIVLDDPALKSAMISKWKMIFHYFSRFFFPRNQVSECIY